MTRFSVTVTAAVIGAVLGVAAWAQSAPTRKAYFVAQIDVSNPQQYGEYTKLSPGIIERYGGRFVARGGRAATLEGPAGPGRVVIVEFPSFERAQQFYDSPEYAAARKVRAGAATFSAVLVEGL
jgi:uncharacterized protein (DUF1330 family)